MDMDSTWRPFYLRPTVLASYGIILALLIAFLEALLAVSEQSSGLAPGRNDLRYLWTYGPTAFMTLLTAIWSRVTFQAQSVAPWYRIFDEQSSTKKALLLDYTSMFQPVAIFRSMRNRDWAVGVSILGLLISQLAVALSTGLFQIDWENEYLESVPIVLETAFSSDRHTVEPLSTLDHYATLETFGGNTQYRPGTTGVFAYQTFHSGLTEVAELRTTVDGFTADLTCEPASLSLINTSHNTSDSAQISFTTSLKSYQCLMGWNFSLVLYPDSSNDYFPDHMYPAGESNMYVSRLLTSQCDNGTDLDNNRMALVFGIITYSWGPYFRSSELNNYSLSSVEVNNSAQVICQPTYQIARLDLVQNGTNDPWVRQLGDSPTKLQHIRPWHITEAMLATQNLTIPDTISPVQRLFSETQASIDNFTTNLFQNGGYPAVQSLVDHRFLAALLSRYYRLFTAQIASISLMDPISDSSTASATIRRFRLTVNYAACQELVALLSVLLVCCITVLILRWKKPPLAHRTNHIVGMATACTNNMTVMDSICSLNQSGDKKLKYLDSQSSYLAFKNNMLSSETTQLYKKDDLPDKDQKLNIGTIIPQKYFQAPGDCPNVLRHMVVGLMVAFLIAMIGVLETLLQMSQKNGVFCKFSDGPYVRYGFTIVPALILGLVAIYFGSVDYESRTLTPYWLMSGRPRSTISLRSDFLNSATPRIIWSEIRSRSYVSLAITLATLIASLFTTFTSPLFSGIVTSQVSAIQIQTNANGTLRTFPSSNMGGGSDMIMSSLILRANLTYPANTYEDLAFVGTVVRASDRKWNTTLTSNNTLQSNTTMQSNGTIGSPDYSAALIHATLPALRARLDCRFPNFHIHPIGQWFKVYMDEEDDSRPLIFMPGNVSSSGSIFGLTTSADSSLIYAWGQVFNTTSTGGGYSINATVMACNETVQAVDVQTVFYARNYSIYPDIPPRADEATMRLSSARYSIPPEEDIYQGLLINGSKPLIDTFFDFLTISREAVPFEDLGDTSKAGEVETAIRRQHGIIRAQFTNENMRYESKWETSIALPDRYPPSDDRNRDVTYSAQLEIPKAQFCIIQDATATRILESLLAVVILLISVARACESRTNILPQNPRSIASILALVVGGNLFQFLKVNSEDTVEDSDESSKQEDLFADGYVCWLGWKKPKENEGEEETARYGIWILTPQEVEDAERIQKEEAEAIKRTKRKRRGGKRSSFLWWRNRPYTPL